MCGCATHCQSHREIKKETGRVGGKRDKKREEFYKTDSTTMMNSTILTVHNSDSTAMMQIQCKFYRVLQVTEIL
jgi:hypothetical protein